MKMFHVLGIAIKNRDWFNESGVTGPLENLPDTLLSCCSDKEPLLGHHSCKISSHRLDIGGKILHKNKNHLWFLSTLWLFNIAMGNCPFIGDKMTIYRQSYKMVIFQFANSIRADVPGKICLVNGSQPGAYLQTSEYAWCLICFSKARIKISEQPPQRQVVY